MELTKEEQKLIEVIRDSKIEFGQIPIVLYYRHYKLVRVEIEKIVVSKAIKV